MSKVIGYVRVSTEEQKLHGGSIQAQIQFLKSYAKINNLGNIYIYNDEGYSAKNTKRPNYQKLIKEIKERKVSKIVIHKIDRLTRNVKEFQELVELCQKFCVTITSIQENLNFDTASGRFMVNLYVGMSQMEREQISERICFSFEGRLKTGQWPFSNKLPLGISKDKHKKLYYNNDIKIVKEILDMYYEDKKIINQIHKHIYKKYPDKIGKCSKIIYRILDCNLYRGFYIYKGTKYELIEKITNHSGKRCNRRKLNKYYYKLADKCFFNDLPLEKYSSTYIRPNGTLREQLYYRNRVNNPFWIKYHLEKNIKFERISFREEYIIKSIEDFFLDINYDIEKQKKQKLKQFQGYLTTNLITQEEYISLRDGLNELDVFINLDLIEKINFNDKVTFDLTYNKKTYKNIKYKKKRIIPKE